MPGKVYNEKVLDFALTEKVNIIKKPLNSKGAAIFKKMLEDKNALHEYLKKGGKIEDFKRNRSFH